MPFSEHNKLTKHVIFKHNYSANHVSIKNILRLFHESLIIRINTKYIKSTSFSILLKL